jgi:hypothetical protein
VSVPKVATAPTVRGVVIRALFVASQRKPKVAVQIVADPSLVE